MNAPLVSQDRPYDAPIQRMDLMDSGFVDTVPRFSLAPVLAEDIA
jgi:hypothetical protein